MASCQLTLHAQSRWLMILWSVYFAGLLGLTVTTIWAPRVLGNNGFPILFGLFAYRFAIFRISRHIWRSAETNDSSSRLGENDSTAKASHLDSLHEP